MFSSSTVQLGVITLAAATVNGALGYGFSSITVPLALLFLTNRVLNPALVLVEVVLNSYVLFVNRASIPAVWRRTVPIIIGLVPGIAVGTIFVTHVNPSWLKLGTFVTLLPLILLQAAGFRRPIKSERGAGLAFGSGLGVLYSVTTISRSAAGSGVEQSRSGKTGVPRRSRARAPRRVDDDGGRVLYAGMFTMESIALIPQIVPSLLIGVPIGAFLIRRIRARDVPTRLHEFRCLGRWLRDLDLAASVADCAGHVCVCGVGRGNHTGCMALVSVLRHPARDRQCDRGVPSLPESLGLV